MYFTLKLVWNTVFKRILTFYTNTDMLTQRLVLLLVVSDKNLFGIYTALPNDAVRLLVIGYSYWWTIMNSLDICGTRCACNYYNFQRFHRCEWWKKKEKSLWTVQRLRVSTYSIYTCYIQRMISRLILTKDLRAMERENFIS